jgi:hypothetical protein
MGGYYINVNIKADSVDAVRDAVIAVFDAEKFTLIQNEQASSVVDNEERLPDGDDWYGLLISSRTDNDWVTVYVDDWKDCGLLARRVSEMLDTQALEIWVADDVNWGYTYWERGIVADRFADDPCVLTTHPAELELYYGNPAALGDILEVTDDVFAKALSVARDRAGQFSGPCVGDLCEAIALPFEQAFTAYEYFFTDDPDDYSVDIPHWPEFRHLAFRHPDGRERLCE